MILARCAKPECGSAIVDGARTEMPPAGVVRRYMRCSGWQRLPNDPDTGEARGLCRICRQTSGATW